MTHLFARWTVPALALVAPLAAHASWGWVAEKDDAGAFQGAVAVGHSQGGPSLALRCTPVNGEVEWTITLSASRYFQSYVDGADQLMALIESPKRYAYLFTKKSLGEGVLEAGSVAPLLAHLKTTDVLRIGVGNDPLVPMEPPGEMLLRAERACVEASGRQTKQP